MLGRNVLSLLKREQLNRLFAGPFHSYCSKNLACLHDPRLKGKKMMKNSFKTQFWDQKRILWSLLSKALIAKKSKDFTSPKHGLTSLSLPCLIATIILPSPINQCSTNSNLSQSKQFHLTFCTSPSDFTFCTIKQTLAASFPLRLLTMCIKTE